MPHSATFFCPCSEQVQLSRNLDLESLKLDTFPITIAHGETLHRLSDLTYCQHCNAIKCRKCIEVEIACKYCPKCMKQTKIEYSTCSKNCVDCPLCGSDVVINLDQTRKVYNINCINCDWEWQSSKMDKPRTLAREVKYEVGEEPDAVFFFQLQELYMSRKHSNIEDMGLDRDLLLKFEEAKIAFHLKDNDIHSFLETNIVKSFEPEDEDEDVETFASLTNNATLLRSSKSLSQDHSPRFKSQAFPIPTKLTSKSSKRCKACRTSLMKPDTDPFSTKFYKISNAVDFLPSIQAHNYPSDSNVNSKSRYILVLKNPLDVPMNITLSSSVEDGFPHKLHLPVSTFKIGAKPANYSKLDTFVKCFPYVELTRNTKLGRVELMNRPQPNFDNFESVLEQRQNFIMIPVKISKSSDHDQEDVQVKIPLFVSLQTDLFSTGFWCILHFNE